MESAALILLGLQLALLVPLAVLGLHRGWIVLQWVRHRARAERDEPVAEADLPAVTVQLPIFNERYVAARLIEAVSNIDYPRDRLDIQVLDDSTDDTSAIIARTLRSLPADVRIAHLQRSDRTGFKAGALAAGLARARGELIAVFDADFVPPRDFLRAVAPCFRDARIGMAQTRWDHLNLGDSLLTRMQGLLLDAHFVIEHAARAHSGCFFNFNGTAGVFRRRCIEEAGGWQHDTLTEDLDLSYRAQLAGWTFAYRPDIACPAELPRDMNAFLNQQHRWAKGSIQTARKLLGRIWRAPLPLRTRLEATFHLCGNAAFPLLLLLILVGLPLQIARSLGASPVTSLIGFVEGLPLLFSTLCVLVYYGTSQLGIARFTAGTLARLPLVLAIGAGMCVNNTLAVLSGLRGEVGIFRRTPKLAGDARAPDATYRCQRGALPLAELALGIWAATTAILAARLQLPWTMVFHGLFAAGLLWVGVRSLAAERPQRALAPTALHPS
jgi:cellulose synthase/poly-beta-1,6-N-acetylglucosamine synthase-like glycosyltransferase